jgi:glycosyltransferase involved in cell wall biosynthesis
VTAPRGAASTLISNIKRPRGSEERRWQKEITMRAISHLSVLDYDRTAGTNLTPSVSVVIPTLNEASNLPYVLGRLPSVVTEVIIVDGHSTDDTVAVARASRPDAKVVLQDGMGKGNALTCGFRAVTGDITVMLDADGSTDPAEIPRFVAALTAGYDFAKGTRFVTGGGSADITPLRRLGNWGLTAMVNHIWDVHYSDLCYGYNAFWTQCMAAASIECNGFEIETLINIRLAEMAIKVIEVPSFESNRRYGTSNLKAGRDGIRVVRTILAEWIRPV